ncbi:Lachesin [Eumeta japonica]|uniref:Hemolin n=1 Tax=Eumeta variegata TaxID=151549 RepID=A0A4C1YZS4_EUMVA|nr:Lachesin [Eumeta japonica]
MSALSKKRLFPYYASIFTILFPAIESSVGQIVIEGMNLTLTCNVTGFPQPTLIWVKETSNKENIKLTPDKAQFGANSVTIQNLTMADSGTYICYATNDIGKGSAKKINIKVLGKPHVRVQRPVINSAPNIEAVLECMVQEEPLADIHWYKDGELLNITKFKIETIEQNSTLRVTPQTEDEFGVFTCKKADTSTGKCLVLFCNVPGAHGRKVTGRSRRFGVLFRFSTQQERDLAESSTSK